MDFKLYGNRTIMLSKTNGGKSQLLKYILMKEIKRFNKIFVFSLTEPVNKFYSNFIDEKCIFNIINEKWINNLMNKMTELKNEGINYNVLLIFDDMGNEEIMKSKKMKTLFTLGRHVNISIVILIQYLYMIPPTIRNNLSYLMCGQVNKLSIDMIADEFNNSIISKQEFIKIYNENTKDYNFLIINNNSVKNNDDINLLYGTIKANV